MMKVRKIPVLLMAICLTFTLCACYDNLMAKGMEIVSYPDKLIYVISIDDSLNLDGGVTRTLFKNHSPIENPMSKIANSSHNIDFTKEGVYVVKIGGGEISVSFPVQVVSIETLEGILNSKAG